MQNYPKIAKPQPIPQSQPLRSDQVPNAAGGYVWATDRWEQLDRFLMLGTVGGSYYIGERELTMQNVESIDQCIAEDAVRVASRAATISHEGRALKNDPAIFVLARVAVSGGAAARRAALDALPTVCRIPTHLFHFVEFHKALGGKWNRSLRQAIARWYLDKSELGLALHLTKYQSRDGWSNADLLRLAHVKPQTIAQSWMFAHAIGKPSELAAPPGVAAYYEALALLQQPDLGPAMAGHLIRQACLPREVVPTHLLRHREVWEALLPEMPTTALIRNLGKLTSVEVIGPMQAGDVVAALTNPVRLKRGRAHPLALLMAADVYRQGHGEKGSLVWSPNQQVVAALQEAFYKAFGNVVPTGKRLMTALDVSGSMQQNMVAGTHLTAAEAGAAVALVLAATEPNVWSTAFGDEFHEFPIGRFTSLQEVMTQAAQFNEATDCSVPIREALARKIVVDAFVLITDNETWSGRTHPHAALQEYRQQVNPAAKAALLTTTPNRSRITAPEDGRALNVVGFDASALDVVAGFLRD